MAKTAKTRNPDRKSGKAWPKSHSAPVNTLSAEDLERKAAKDKARLSRATGNGPGFSLTMPRITWQWAQDMMADRWPNTKRLRVFDGVLAQERGRAGDTTPSIELVPEVKPVRRKGR